MSFCIINFRKSIKKIKFMKEFLSNNRKYGVASLFCLSGLSKCNPLSSVGKGGLQIPTRKRFLTASECLGRFSWKLNPTKKICQSHLYIKISKWKLMSAHVCWKIFSRYSCFVVFIFLFLTVFSRGIVIKVTIDETQI